uniref:Uncharacterized protein n=1 Tax=Manihot esculenta TaxID=3983 RepID=A0A2C9UBY4_MANES
MINDWKRWKRIHQENKGTEKKDSQILLSLYPFQLLRMHKVSPVCNCKYTSSMP